MARISIITNTFPPELGAAPSRIFDMAKGLKEAGYEVEVLTGMPNYPTPSVYKAYQGKIFCKESIGGVAVRRHWMYASHSDKYISRFLNMTSLAFSMLLSLPHLLRKRPDYIIVQYPPVMVPIFALFIAAITRAKLILNVSDLWPIAIHELDLIKKGKLYKSLEKLEKLLYNKCDFALVQSNEIKAHIQTKSSKPVLLFRTGVDTRLFQQKENYEVQGKKFKVIYAGVMGVAHGILQLCKDVNFKWYGAELHIYGDGFEFEKVKTYLKKFPEKGIKLFKAVPQKKLAEIMQEYDAALISQKKRIHGTVPSKVYEALSVGLPILFNGGGEGGKIVEAAGAGLISNPVRPEELISNLKKMIAAKPASLSAMGNRGRKTAEEEFDRKKQIESLIKALNTLDLKGELTDPDQYVEGFLQE
ncbi:glycosyltransferase family 4 protein [Flexithrix dorotheae]|uniref:glycosyltransferase family 4 protein n=1 Tax=Flexithrix dorotheae TaxID=70993 RepID=UPI000364C909|nr:glycosyltransferase family 4 protein [Flexithrix dorotheae]